MNTQDTVPAEIISDHEIITRVLGGEKDLFALLVRRYNQRVYRVVMAIINDDNEAEDVMQAGYIKAFENLARFEFRSAFSTWLTRIVINECLLRKKKQRKQAVLAGSLMDMETRAGVQTPHMKVVNTELREILEDAIRRLPEKYRTVFILREIEDLNVSETQECLGLTEANVKVRLNRAKTMLRDSLSAYYKKDDILHFHLSRCDRVTENVMRRVNLL